MSMVGDYWDGSGLAFFIQTGFTFEHGSDNTLFLIWEAPGADLGRNCLQRQLRGLTSAHKFSLMKSETKPRFTI